MFIYKCLATMTKLYRQNTRWSRLQYSLTLPSWRKRKKLKTGFRVAPEKHVLTDIWGQLQHYNMSEYTSTPLKTDSIPKPNPSRYPKIYVKIMRENSGGVYKAIFLKASHKVWGRCLRTINWYCINRLKYVWMSENLTNHTDVLILHTK